MSDWLGTGVPVVIPPEPGTDGDVEYGAAFPYTLLSLARYAQILNLDPIYFFGGYSSLRTAGACNDTWFEYSWQDGGKVSRQEINLQILRAEQEIADFVGFWPAPRWRW